MLWFKWFLYWKWNYVLWLRWYYLCNFVKILWSIRNQYIRSITNSIISKLPPMKINDCNRKLMRLWFLKCWSLKRNQFNIKNKHFSRQQFTWVLAGVRCCKVKLINNYDDGIIKNWDFHYSRSKISSYHLFVQLVDICQICYKSEWNWALKGMI